jgi:hypothetical protein
MEFEKGKPSISEVYLEEHLKEVSASDFYRDIFPVGSFEQKGVYEDGKYNGILLRFSFKSENELGKPKRYTVTDDLELITKAGDDFDTFSLMSPICYCGKSRKFENARFMYALAIDLDGVKSVKHVENLFWQFNAHRSGQVDKRAGTFVGLTEPTYLVSSGTGIHIYWVFKKPVPMFKNVVDELSKLKERLTWQAWTQGSSSLSKNIQYEPLNQGFRCVGTRTKTKRLVRAFKWRRGRKVTIADLNACVPERDRANVDEETFGYRSSKSKSTMSLEQAKEEYPDWYQKRVVEKQPKGSWTCHPGLYGWWLKRLQEGDEVTEGHRYWCIHFLAVYAKKCDIEFEELKQDAYSLIDSFNELTTSSENQFTREDVAAALNGYKEQYRRYSIRSIEYRTGLHIERNKRNGRSQEQHVKIMTAIRDVVYPDGEWGNKNGRPKGSGTKKELIIAYKKEHPKATQRDIAKALNVSPTTVNKWLKTS